MSLLRTVVLLLLGAQSILSCRYVTNSDRHIKSIIGSVPIDFCITSWNNESDDNRYLSYAFTCNSTGYPYYNEWDSFRCSGNTINSHPVTTYDFDCNNYTPDCDLYILNTTTYSSQYDDSCAGRGFFSDFCTKACMNESNHQQRFAEMVRLFPQNDDCNRPYGLYVDKSNAAYCTAYSGTNYLYTETWIDDRSCSGGGYESHYLSPSSCYRNKQTNVYPYIYMNEMLLYGCGYNMVDLNQMYLNQRYIGNGMNSTQITSTSAEATNTEIIDTKMSVIQSTASKTITTRIEDINSGEGNMCFSFYYNSRNNIFVLIFFIMLVFV